MRAYPCKTLLSRLVVDALSYAMHSKFQNFLFVPNSAVQRMKRQEVRALVHGDIITFTYVARDASKQVGVSVDDATHLHYWVVLCYIIDLMPGRELRITEAELLAAADVAVVSITLEQRGITAISEAATAPALQGSTAQLYVRNSLGGYSILDTRPYGPGESIH